MRIRIKNLGRGSEFLFYCLPGRVSDPDLIEFKFAELLDPDPNL